MKHEMQSMDPHTRSPISGTASSSFDRLVSEYLALYRLGRAPDIECYANQQGAHAESLRQLLPTMVMLETIAQPGSSDSQCPQNLGDYKLIREIGRGGMGIVYEAEQISLSRRVAVKILPFLGSLDSQQLKRFRNESQIAAALCHQNIIPVFHVGLERGVHFYAMQLVVGYNLDEAIRATRGRTPGRTESPKIRCGNAPKTASGSASLRAASEEKTKETVVGPLDDFRNVAAIGLQVARALQHAHDMGILHRDIKPSNLLLDADGKVWVADFGLARTAAASSLTRTGDMVGTLIYMSPDQLAGSGKTVDERFDVYSLCATLYEMTTLRPAFADGDRAELIRMILNVDPPRPRSIRATIPVELETIILKGMEKAPQSRYQTAGELADDLLRFLNHEPIRARPSTLVDRACKWASRNPSLVRVSVVMLLFSLTLLVASGLVMRESARDVAASFKTAEHSSRVAQETNTFVAEYLFLQAALHLPLLPPEADVADLAACG